MPNHDDKGRALARLAINTVTSSRVGNILFPKKRMNKELKQSAGKRPRILDASKLNEEERKKYADSSLQALRKRYFGMANPRLDKTNFKQEAPRLYNTKNPLNYHGGDPGEEKMGPKKLRLRKIKGIDPKGYMGGYAPIGGGGFGRIAGAFANTARQYLTRSGFVGKNILSVLKQARKAKKKTTREQVTGMSEKYFKNVEKSLEANPKLKKSSSGYYTFK